jgi:hypothetical protein
MKRVGAIAIFSGAVVLSTHIIAPAEPPASRPEVLAAALNAAAQSRPLLENVDAEVDRLRERLAAPPDYPAPARDPFRFGAAPPRSPGARAAAEARDAAEAAAPPAPTAPALPQLIAIATDAVEGAVVRSAVLAVGGDVQVVRAGEVFSRFSVASVGENDVELLESSTGQAFRISLR